VGLGLAAAVYVTCDPSSQQLFSCRDMALPLVALGGGAGAAIGIMVDSVKPTESWRPGAWSEANRAAVRGSRGVRVGVRVGF